MTRKELETALADLLERRAKVQGVTWAGALLAHHLNEQIKKTKLELIKVQP